MVVVMAMLSKTQMHAKFVTVGLLPTKRAQKYKLSLTKMLSPNCCQLQEIQVSVFILATEENEFQNTYPVLRFS